MNKINNSSYREYLKNNADSIIRKNQVIFCNYNKFAPKINNNKYIFNSINDKKKPFGYETSDLKRDYINNQILKQNSTAPIITKYFLNQLKR
jgi:hypothetical protein